MSIAGAIWLLLAGAVSLPGIWNAARPVGDPTRRYSPLWLPAMVIVELATFWLVVHLLVGAIGVAIGGLDHVVGLVGIVLLGVSALLLTMLRIRSSVGARRLRRHATGAVRPTRRWWGISPARQRSTSALIDRRDVEFAPSRTADLLYAAAAADDAPVFIYVHGGGWTGGSPQRQAVDVYETLAHAGWTVVSIRYPFAPDATVEQQIGVVKEAVRWARSELPKVVGRATGAVAIGGGSAGGHLAAMASLTATGDDERVDACVGMYGVYDMANRNRTRAYWGKLRHVVMQCSYRDEPDRYHAVSPIDHIHDRTAPFLIIHGTHDTLVPIAEGRQFVELLRQGGRPVDFVPVYGAQHAYDALSGITSRTTAAVVRDWLSAHA
jgi:acetyl esterase/lipase